MDTYFSPVYDPIGDIEPGAPAAANSATAEDLALLDAYSRAVIDVVDRVGPAVVGLAARGNGDGAARSRGGSGSGVVVAPDGLILTNSHVADAAGSGSRIEVTTADGQDLRAFTGTYGDYLLGKVSKVFPQLRQDALG